jgi:hypothetical protein
MIDVAKLTKADKGRTVFFSGSTGTREQGTLELWVTSGTEHDRTHVLIKLQRETRMVRVNCVYWESEDSVNLHETQGDRDFLLACGIAGE